MDVSFIKNNRSISIIRKFLYCILLIAFLSVVIQKGYTIIAYNTPKELREMNTVVFAYNFAYGNNLYAVSALDNEIPVATSMYGFLVPLVLSPFIRLLSFTGLNPLQICELLTLIIELVGAAFFYRIVHRKTGSHLLSAAGMLLFYSCYWRYSFFAGAFPDQWGLTLSIVLMDILHFDEKKHRYHPDVYAFVLVLLFYIKQYFVCATIGFCVYLFIYSKKDLIKIMFYGIGFGIISVFLVYSIFPLYFSEAFPIGQGQALTIDWGYSLMQIKRLSIHYGCIMIFFVVGILLNFYTVITKKRIIGEVSFELCQIIFILPLLAYLARNQGTIYTYYLQLWYPYIILYSIVSIPVIAKYIARIPKKNCRIVFTMLSCILVTLAVGNIMLSDSSFSEVMTPSALPTLRCNLMTEEQREAWNRAFKILKEEGEHAAEGEVLVSMHLTEYCLENHIETSNYGQAEFNDVSNLQNFRDSSLWQNIFLFKYAEEIVQKNIAYNEKIRDNIYNHKYRCIASVYAKEFGLTDEDFVDAGYRVLVKEELMTGKQCWNTTFYVLP